MNKTLLYNIGLLATPEGKAAKGGKAQGEIRFYHNAWLLTDEDGRIAGIGEGEPTVDLKEIDPETERIGLVDAMGGLVTPGLIDAHTHLVFGGWRQNEMGLKLHGASYLDILNAGGGIHSTVKATREASEEELFLKAFRQLQEMNSLGVTACEMKSGYGLDRETELKQLRVIRRLKERNIAEVVPTYLGAHALPQEYKDQREEYIRLLCEERIPEIAREGLAEYVDVFCEKGVFTAEESRKILEAGLACGLKAKIHADEIEAIGGSELAGELKATSAEHLIKCTPEGIEALAKGGVIACLLPATSLYLGAEFAPARAMIEAGIPIAVASDFNPGSCPSNNLQLAMNLACLKYKMTPEEMLTAVTLNAAAAVGRAERLGSLEIGKQADLVIWDAPDLDYLGYRMGSNLAMAVYQKGICHSVKFLPPQQLRQRPKETAPENEAAENAETVTITGHSLTLESFVEVARFGKKVRLSAGAKKRMQASRDLTEKIAAEGRVAYGITTGFGDFQKVAVPEELSNQLSTNLILSHCTAAGEPYPDDVTRGIMLLRANALCGGFSGVRPVLVEMLVEMLNKNVLPVIPQKGSLGSSGDLAPLAHMTLPLLGLGEAKFEGAVLPGAEAMRRAGIPTLDTLVSKEGLGMTNGTCAMTSVGALALYDTLRAAKMADVIASMDFEALTGLKNAFDDRIHQVRRNWGQICVAQNMRRLLEGSEIIDNCQHDRVQDAYALRCIPQVHGAVRNALDYICSQVEGELNAVTDNPLIFPGDEAVISGGNFHGEPMAIPFDTLGIAAAELAGISERRLERMVNAQLSNGLTPFLTKEAGVNSGFMIVQYAAASMVSENKIYAHPACVDSIPSSAGQEDFVSMGTTAARTAAMIVENLYNVLADELLTACQAIDIRRMLNTHGQSLTPLHQAIYDKVRETIPTYDRDREIWPDIREAERLVRSGEILKLAEELLPELL